MELGDAGLFFLTGMFMINMPQVSDPCRGGLDGKERRKMIICILNDHDQHHLNRAFKKTSRNCFIDLLFIIIIRA